MWVAMGFASVRIASDTILDVAMVVRSRVQGVP